MNSNKKKNKRGGYITMVIPLMACEYDAISKARSLVKRGRERERDLEEFDRHEKRVNWW